MAGLNLVDRAYEIWSSDIRYIGVGSMVVGGIASIFKVRHGLINAINILKDNQKFKVKILENTEKIYHLS